MERAWRGGLCGEQDDKGVVGTGAGGLDQGEAGEDAGTKGRGQGEVGEGQELHTLVRGTRLSQEGFVGQGRNPAPQGITRSASDG